MINKISKNSLLDSDTKMDTQQVSTAGKLETTQPKQRQRFKISGRMHLQKSLTTNSASHNGTEVFLKDLE